MGNIHDMKLRVLRDFYDTTANKRLRLRGSMYDEPNKKRAMTLADGEFVQIIQMDPETPTGIPEMETKKTQPRKSPRKPRKKPTKK